eukprot:TRINITY_DN9911_c0_g1_i2.p1 TRINITY_DN9911_c0_g1~~TRINITY_DN9911_c0_g1_i2.p1  ORF type:complete len:388 (+),score=57.41 TRINITY_DN9911_c0_g1_i2:64-1227(+)
MSKWSLAYATACSEKGILPRMEYQESDDDLQSLILNGNCPERFGCRVNDIEAEVLSNVLSKTSNITEIDLSYNEVTDVGAEHIANMLRTNTSLQHISLAYCDIKYTGWRAMTDALMHNRTLQSLVMAGNSITGDDDPSKPELREIGGASIGTLLRENHTLSSLNFSSCGLGVCSIVGIAQALIDHPSVTSLNISSPNLSSYQERTSAVQHLSEMLRKNNALVELNMTRMHLCDDQVAMMLPALVYNDTLRSVLMPGNKLSQDGGVEVSKLLARRHDISVVDISSNVIESAGAAAIASTLRANQGIGCLNLSFCGIGESGLISLIEALTSNHGITTLLLWGNAWTPLAVKCLYDHRSRIEDLAYFDCDLHVVDGVPQIALGEHGGIRS